MKSYSHPSSPVIHHQPQKFQSSLANTANSWLPPLYIDRTTKQRSSPSIKRHADQLKGEINTAAMAGIEQDECNASATADTQLKGVSSIIGDDHQFERQQCSVRKQKKAVCNVL